jgi:hypothetical protein
MRLLGVVLTASALVSLAFVVGCGGDKGGSSGGATTGPKKDGGGPAPSGEKTAVEGKGVATVKGTITFVGDAPKPSDNGDQMKAQEDKAHCLKDDPKNPDPTHGRNWAVKDGKVANTVVWVAPPTGKYFKFTDDEKKAWPPEVKVDQPFCHFEPHVSVAFPKYYDGAAKKAAETGQKIVVHNGAPISHNTKWQGESRKVPQGNQTIAAGGNLPLTLEADSTVPVRLNCDIHKWMEGYIWVLDTPYAAVTKADGTYEIQNVPAGVPLQIVVWHEDLPDDGFSVTGKKGQAITLNSGDNTKDFQIKK